MSLWNHYHRPTTVNEALTLKVRYGDTAKLIAGGTDLILDLRGEASYGAGLTSQTQPHGQPLEALIDVTQIEGLNQIRKEPAWVILGAAVTHTQIEQSLLIQHHGRCLVESCHVIGGPQVRNVATIGGNVAHALPAADGSIGLLALDAEVQVASLEDNQVVHLWQPLLSIFAGPGRNNLEHHQMITAFRFAHRRPRQASAFDRIMRPQGIALPVLGLAACLTLDETATRVIHAKIAIGPAGPVPFRAGEAEAVLTAASTFDETVVEAAITAAQAQAKLRTSVHRASQAYRHAMVGVLLRRVLPTAFSRAQADPGAGLRESSAATA